ncbi:MAG: L-threonylcarbamoyladenylate synthase [bacterium]|nr:L-threonylcarbamoyladenylate synthase [bacterium]
MKVIKENKETIKEAVKVLTGGGLVIFPTETVYGIGVDATNAKAVKKLNSYKQRPFGKPYSIAVSGQKMAEEYVELNQTAGNLYRQFLPGPVTIVSSGKHKVAPGVESETGTLGIRIPDYELIINIVRALDKPITATSANASYKKRPYKTSDVLDNISKKQKKLIDLIIDAGELPRNEPSTVIDTTMDDPVVLRQGEIKLKDKNEVLSRSGENTRNIAKELFQKYESYLGQRSLVFALEGPMGSGKTQFTKGLAKAMGIKETVTSPTYNLLHTYKSSVVHNDLTHIDAWRMQNSKELNALEFTKYLLDKNNVIAIEWADRVAVTIRTHSDDAVIVWVKIEYLNTDNFRRISWDIL